MSTVAFQRKLSVMVAYPSLGEVKARFNNCLVNMITYYMSDPVPGYRQQMIKPMNVRGSIIPRQRMMAVKEALKDGFTHILWVDSDQTFPKDTIHRLLVHDRDVVGCNIATKQIPASPTARKRGGNIGGEPVYTDPDSPPLESVWRLGCGIMLMRMSVFEKIGLGCFEIRWEPEIQDYRGEDWSMCKALEAAGLEIWVDHRLSDEVKHVGDFEYDHNVVGQKVVEVREDKRIGEA